MIKQPPRSLNWLQWLYGRRSKYETLTSTPTYNLENISDTLVTAFPVQLRIISVNFFTALLFTDVGYQLIVAFKYKLFIQ